MPFNLVQQLKNKMISKVQSFLNSDKYLAIQIDITNACNLKCAHCYHPNHDNAGAIGKEEWLKIIDQYDELLKKLNKMPSIIICGGEPFFSPLLIPLIENFKERWNFPKITILTNGTLIRDEKLAQLEGCNVKFQVSLDGPDEQRHDEVRGKGSFNRTLKGIEKLRARGFEVQALAILSNKTSSWIPEFFRLAKQLDLSKMNFTRLIKQGEGIELVNSGKDCPLEPLELKSAMECILLESSKAGVKTNTNKPLFHLLDENLGRNGRAGFQGLVVDYKGNLKVTSRVNQVLGNVLERGLENLFLEHPLMKNLRDGNIQGCGGCKFYSRCGGDRNAAFAEHGSFLEQDPGCWISQTSLLKEAL